MVKKKRIFLLIIIICGIITGIVFANILSHNDKVLVEEKISSYFINIKKGIKIDYLLTIKNSFKNNFITLTIISILGVSIIGLFINNFLLFFKSFILGFTLGSIINIYLYKGLILAFFYLFPHYFINLFCYYIIVYLANNFSLLLFQNIFRKQNIKLSKYFLKYCKNILYIGIILFISSFLETFLSPFFIKLFIFLI